MAHCYLWWWCCKLNLLQLCNSTPVSMAARGKGCDNVLSFSTLLFSSLLFSYPPLPNPSLSSSSQPPFHIDAVAQVRGTVGAGSKKMGVTSAVSDESVAGDSGVYEPSETRWVL